MEDLMKNVVEQVVDSATSEIVDGVIVETVETTEIPSENLAWEVADVMIDTGAGDALLALTGGPVVLVLAYKVFKKWRKNIREKQMMGKA